MIGSLRGRLLDRSGSEITVEVSGLGYRVSTTPATSGALGAVGDEVFVWVLHHIREDAQTLFGFASVDERDLFETLIGTHGVGPSLGLAILSTHTPRGLRLAVATDDVAALCLVPGVGKKTAQRLLVELTSRLDVGSVDLRSIEPVGGDVPDGAEHSAQADVREALAGLGYSADEIARVLVTLPAEQDSAMLLRAALQVLAAG